MFFTREQYDHMYELLYNWMATHTSGGRAYKSLLKMYQKELWDPVIEIINRLSAKSRLNEIEKEFLNLVHYTGTIYRIQDYNPRYKGYICENDFYQSWSRNIAGVSKVPILGDTVLLIVGRAVNGIDVFGLLEFLFKNNYVTPSEWKNPYGLCRYEEEEEIVYPIQFKHITDVVAIDKDKLLDWEEHKKIIPKDKWKRNSIN